MGDAPQHQSRTADRSIGSVLAGLWYRLKSFREGPLILTIIVIGIAMTFLSPYFLTAQNIKTTVLSFSINGIVVIGMTVVLISGGLDLSVGSVMAVTGAFAGMLFQSGMPVYAAGVFGVLMGTFIGAFNAFFITRIGLNAFITTLAMMGIARGGAFVITQGTPLSLYSMPDAFKWIGKGTIGGIPFVIILFLILIVAFDYMMRRSKIMRKTFYIGSNEQAAIYSGVNTQRIKFGVYVLSSTLAGVAGVLSIARFATATPYHGQGFELQAIAACVIGGASLAGGQGSILGSVLGIALLSVITSSLILLNVSPYWQQLVSGTILLLAVTMDYLSNKRRS